MKKIIILISLIFFLIVSVSAATIGDVNNDGKVTSLDYILVRKHLLGTVTLTNTQKTSADANKDNKISSLDYIKIKQIVISGNTNTVTSSTNPTPTSTINPNQTYIETYFLNTINNSSFNDKIYQGNEAIIIKTINNKYVLLDTGIESSSIKKVIYNKLKELQKNTKVSIDYMIVSHLHGDHYGNAVSILKDANFDVKNVIMKKEKLQTKIYNDITTAAASNKKTKVIESSALAEGKVYQLQDNINMYLFNVKDIYEKDICDKTDYIFMISSSIKSTYPYAKTTNGKYFYFDGMEYINLDKNGKGNNVTFHTIDKLEAKVDVNNRMNSRFYAVYQKRTQCSSNANSIALVFQVKTNKGNKYIYLPSDLEQNGYSPFGEYDNNYGTVMHGYSPTYFFKYKMVNGEPRFIIENNKLVSDTEKNVKKPMDYIVAKTIKGKFKDIIGNIAIYQVAHHGLNNSKESMELLQLNKSNVNAITPASINIKKDKTFHVIETEYVLSNTKMMYVGDTNYQGIKCIIGGSGKYNCQQY